MHCNGVWVFHEDKIFFPSERIFRIGFPLKLGSEWFSNETLVQSFNKWGSRRNSRSRSKDLSDNRWRSLVPGNLVSKTSESSSHPSLYSTLSTPSGKFHDRFLQKSSEQSCWNPVPVLNKSRRSWFGRQSREDWVKLWDHSNSLAQLNFSVLACLDQLCSVIKCFPRILNFIIFSFTRTVQLEIWLWEYVMLTCSLSDFGDKIQRYK